MTRRKQGGACVCSLSLFSVSLRATVATPQGLGPYTEDPVRAQPPFLVGERKNIRLTGEKEKGGFESENGGRSVVSNSSRPMDCSPPGSSVHGILQAGIFKNPCQ